MKKLLLASTALVGASLLAAPVMAGTPSVSDDFSVSIDGTIRFGVLIWDQDVDNTPGDRGYHFQTDEAEIRFRMRGTSDFGLAYGFDIELHTQTDDTSNADETWMFIDGGDVWGRIELGDQDDGGDRLFVSGQDATDAGRGIGGDQGDVLVDGDGRNRTSAGGINITSDHTKIIYITPRFAGIQLGASFTPDEDQNGGDNPASGDGGNDGPNGGDYENIYSIGVNYRNTFNNVEVIVGGMFQGADHENSAIEDLEAWGVGVIIRYAGFEFGAGFADLQEKEITSANDALGEDAGQWYDVGINYKTGPWTVGGGYFHFERDYASTAAVSESDVDVFQFGFDYAVAPGWKIESDIRFIQQDDIDEDGLDNDATIFTIATVMSF